MGGAGAEWLLDGKGNVRYGPVLSFGYQLGCTASTGHRPSTNWSGVGVADLNSDGRNDIFLADRADDVYSVWYLEWTGDVIGTRDIRIQDAGGDHPVHCHCDLVWMFAGVGDRNADGIPDVDPWRAVPQWERMRPGEGGRLRSAMGAGAQPPDRAEAEQMMRKE